MISLFVAISFIASSAWANAGINEYEVDLYYANGMFMDVNKEKAEVVWRARVEQLKKIQSRFTKKHYPPNVLQLLIWRRRYS